MDYVPLLGCSLKSPEIIDFLELHDAEVSYDFDRLNEGQPDAYHAKVPAAGVQLRFDEHQYLRCIFLYTVQSEGMSPADLSATDVRQFQSPDEARSFADTNHIAVSEGSAEFLGEMRIWIRLEWEAHTIHYEFRGESLALVTLARRAPD